MSYFYNSIELPYRLTIFTTGNRVNDIISPLLALGILKMRGTAGREGWRWYVCCVQPSLAPISVVMD